MKELTKQQLAGAIDAAVRAALDADPILAKEIKRLRTSQIQKRKQKREKDRAEMVKNRRARMSKLPEPVPVDEDNCSVGNAFHDPDTGRFTSADKAGSWSITAKKNGRDCESSRFEEKSFLSNFETLFGASNQSKTA